MVIDKVIKYQAHVQKLIKDHYEVIHDAEYLDHYHDNKTPHYASYLWTNENPVFLTEEQVYLKSLLDLIAPVLEAESSYRKISRVRPKLGVWRASERLVSPCKTLAHGAYQFSERLKLYWNSTKALCDAEHARRLLDETLSKQLKSFKSGHKDVLAYRNYLVHGGTKIIDPFRDLTYIEIAAIVGHPDLWFEFQNVFDESQEEWKSRAKFLRRDMLLALSKIQTVNAELLKTGSLELGRKTGVGATLQGGESS